jgi:metal-responsive CopG/Arc/MetJ family transcriptional regulator
VIGVDKVKKAISLDGEVKTVEVRENLWERFSQALESDTMQRFTNRSEAIRYFIIQFVEEVEKQGRG